MAGRRGPWAALEVAAGCRGSRVLKYAPQVRSGKVGTYCRCGTARDCIDGLRLVLKGISLLKLWFKRREPGRGRQSNAARRWRPTGEKHSDGKKAAYAHSRRPASQY